MRKLLWTAISILAALLATGASAQNIDWQRVEMFHLDEYVGLPITHPASFRKYLLERLISKTGITQYHLLDGDRDPGEEPGYGQDRPVQGFQE